MTTTTTQGARGRVASLEAGGDDPVDGTVNANGAVWGGSRWHLIEVHSLLESYEGSYEDAIPSVYQATCSCGWYGRKRVRRLTELGGGATVTVSPHLVAIQDGQYHTFGQ